MLPILTSMLGCASGAPPPDFRPDPIVLDNLVGLRIIASPRACPGEPITATYVGLFDDGSALPFSHDYDRDAPPALHLSFLRRLSLEATPSEDGGWDAHPDPLRSAVSGYRLSAQLWSKPSVHTEHVVEPEYSCIGDTYTFSAPLRGAGPRVVVRLDVFTSPFYERLIVAQITAGEDPPFYVLGDAQRAPPVGWLIIQARGGRGAQGSRGSRGRRGVAGAAGCPGSDGDNGGPGGTGGRGESGGGGGEIVIVVPRDQPDLARLVEPHVPGGLGGSGGSGGPGGRGGSGGEPSEEGCASGLSGADGIGGARGLAGRPGEVGAVQVLGAPRGSVFGSNAPAALRALIEYSAASRR